METSPSKKPAPEAWILLSAIKLAQTARSLDERLALAGSSVHHPDPAADALRCGGHHPSSGGNGAGDTRLAGSLRQTDVGFPLQDLEKDARRLVEMIDRLETLGNLSQGGQLLEEIAERVGLEPPDVGNV